MNEKTERRYCVEVGVTPPLLSFCLVCFLVHVAVDVCVHVWFLLSTRRDPLTWTVKLYRMPTQLFTFLDVFGEWHTLSFVLSFFSACSP